MWQQQMFTAHDAIISTMHERFHRERYLDLRVVLPSLLLLERLQVTAVLDWELGLVDNRPELLANRLLAGANDLHLGKRLRREHEMAAATVFKP